MKSLKYDTLSESKGLKVSANAEGGVNFSAGKANVTLKVLNLKLFIYIFKLSLKNY